jgi:hypothetical protein
MPSEAAVVAHAVEIGESLDDRSRPELCEVVGCRRDLKGRASAGDPRPFAVARQIQQPHRPGTPQPGQVRPLASTVDSAVTLECLAQRRIRGARCVPHRAMGVLMNERTINVSNSKPRAIVVDVALLCAIDAQSRGLFSR